MTWKTRLFIIFAFAAAWSVYHESYVGQWKKTINIDGIGYNAYLPAIFLHDGNLSWACYESVFMHTEVLNNRLQDFRKSTETGRFINKYPPGLAITQMPLWFSAWAIQGFSRNLTGFETPFEWAVFLNNLLWLFLGLWFLVKLCLKYQWPENRALLLVLILLFTTNLFHFITFDNSLTHPVNLGLSFCGLYALDGFARTSSLRMLVGFLLICILLFLLRPINVLMMPFFLMFLLFRNEKKIQWKKIHFIMPGIAAMIALFLYFGDIKWQTGKWFVYSYANEKFVFNEWHLGDILFGYRCGLFLYTPVVALAVIFWFRNFNRKLVFGYLIWIVVTAWFISTWNEYCYGCRLGNRPMIDYFGFFIVPLLSADFRMKRVLKYILLFFLVFCTYYNQILHYQYRHYLLDWCNVQKEQFWEVFMRTHRPN